jgi:hypothetical protein
MHLREISRRRSTPDTIGSVSLKKTIRQSAGNSETAAKQMLRKVRDDLISRVLESNGLRLAEYRRLVAYPNAIFVWIIGGNRGLGLALFMRAIQGFYNPASHAPQVKNERRGKGDRCGNGGSIRRIAGLPRRA